MNRRSQNYHHEKKMKNDRQLTRRRRVIRRIPSVFGMRGKQKESVRSTSFLRKKAPFNSVCKTKFFSSSIVDRGGRYQSMGFQGNRKKRRKTPYPNSILDRQALTEALDEAGVSLKRNHMDGFYQALHRQHYPSLKTFVEIYYQNERKEYSEESKPLVHSLTKRKNRNLLQLPKAFLNFLSETPDFVTKTSKIQKKMTSKDKSTTKLIVELYDGQVVESVLMRYARKGSGRASLCVSSQCGCAMGCTFCATGTMGLSGNLSTAEILEQLVHADSVLAEDFEKAEDKSKKLDLVRNVVFMGMGEPLDNYRNVVAACRAMMDRRRWNLAHGRVTVSTVGLVSQIRKLTKELPEVSLALSLHAPNQEARTAIVPTAVRYPIEDLIDALDNHMMAYLNKGDGEVYTKEERTKESSRRRAMIEYVMLQGETSSFECAHQLGKLCENRQLVVNLIPYNATDVKDKLQCPPADHMQKFRDIVASYGAFCTIRRTMGADIAGACGQLVKKTQNEEEKTVDIEDVIGDKRRETAQKSIFAVNPKGSNSKEGPTKKDTSEQMYSWMESLSTEDLDRWTNILTVAATISASCFLLSGCLFLKKR